MAQQTLPKYRCHKVVQAVKIKAVRPLEQPKWERPICKGAFVLGTACGHCDRCRWHMERGTHNVLMIVPEEPGLQPIPISATYFHKHHPGEGGYYVRYEDGYESFSPAEAFESGYTRIVEPEPKPGIVGKRTVQGVCFGDIGHGSFSFTATWDPDDEESARAFIHNCYLEMHALDRWADDGGAH